jgi:hypothetical protein
MDLPNVLKNVNKGTPRKPKTKVSQHESKKESEWSLYDWLIPGWSDDDDNPDYNDASEPEPGEE